jgi:hypothetical protein
MQAGASLSAGRVENEAFKYKAAEALQDAEYTRIEAQEEADLTRKEGKKVIGGQIAAAGAAGIELSGSMADKIAWTKRDIEEDVRMIYYRGRVRSQRLTDQARVYKWQGAQAMKAGRTGAVGSLLLGGGQMLAMSNLKTTGGVRNSVNNYAGSAGERGASLLSPGGNPYA